MYGSRRPRAGAHRGAVKGEFFKNFSKIAKLVRRRDGIVVACLNLKRRKGSFRRRVSEEGRDAVAENPLLYAGSPNLPRRVAGRRLPAASAGPQHDAAGAGVAPFCLCRISGFRAAPRMRPGGSKGLRAQALTGRATATTRFAARTRAGTCDQLVQFFKKGVTRASSR